MRCFGRFGGFALWLSASSMAAITMPGLAQQDSAPDSAASSTEAPTPTNSGERPVANGRDEDFDALGLETGRIDLTLDARTEFSDNFYYDPDNERSVVGAVIRPSFNYSRSATSAKLAAYGGVTGAVYSFNDEDNFVDYNLGGSADIELAQVQNLSLSANFRHGHDPFGTDRTEGTARADAPLDEWNDTSAGVSYRTIAKAGVGVVFNLGARVQDREYTTNEANTQFLNYTRRIGEVGMGWRFSPKTVTNILYQRIRSDIDKIAPGQRDRSGDTDTLVMGVTWVASTKTRGTAAIGGARRSTDARASSDFSSAYWSAGIDWEPSLRTSFELSTVRTYIESYRLNADFVDATGTSLSWVQNWNSRVNTRLTTSFRRLDFVGTTDDDDYFRLAGRINIRIGEGSSIYLGANHTQRESTRSNLEFERSRGYLGLKTVLN